MADAYRGLLTRRKEGYYVLYAANRENLSAFTQALAWQLNVPGPPAQLPREDGPREPG